MHYNAQEVFDFLPELEFDCVFSADHPNLIGLLSETGRVPPEIGWRIYHSGLPEGWEFALQLSPGVRGFSI